MGKRFVTIDMVGWLQGEEAVKAYRKDNPKSKDPLTDGYYIQNREVKWDTLALVDTAQFVMQTYSHNADGNFQRDEKIEFHQMEQLFISPNQAKYKHIPFWIVISRGRILSISEQYIP